MKIGLVLEGGGMRGLYTAGVIDIMLDHDFEPDVVCSTSAGVTFGVNLLSKQRGIENRNDQYNKRIAQLRQLEEEGKIFVIRPSQEVAIGRLEMDVERLQTVYDLGLQDAQSQWERLEGYLSSSNDRT